MSEWIRGLTVHAPYAWLMGIGEKQYETRHWFARHKGLVAIHQGKDQSVLKNICGYLQEGDRGKPDSFLSHYTQILEARGLPLIDPPLAMGAIIAIGTMTACIQMTEPFIRAQSARVRALGYWVTDRFAWQFENVRLLKTPIPHRGLQNLWYWHMPDDLEFVEP